MATTYDISGTIRLNVNLQHQKIEDLGTVVKDLSISDSIPFAYGTGVNQINKLYGVTQVLADGANATLNLYNSGTLLDSFGNAVAISALKFLYVKNNSTDATLLLFGGNSADIPICSAATGQIKIPPGQSFIYTNPSAAGLVISTNKNLRIEHDGTGTSTMSVDIIVGGI
jgi:hypothetical protein